MIITVTPNPALDQTMFVEEFAPRDLNRARETHLDQAGKGINASRLAHRVRVPRRPDGSAPGSGVGRGGRAASFREGDGANEGECDRSGGGRHGASSDGPGGSTLSEEGRSRTRSAARAVAAILLVAGLVGGYVAFSQNAELQRLLRPEAVRSLIGDLGPWGPVALILSMAVAIVFSPIPSAPLALAAGALYGHTWGTVYSIIGAEIGALIAFGMARALGRPFVASFLPQALFSGASGEEADEGEVEEEDAGRSEAVREIEAEGRDAPTGRSQWLLAGGVLVARLFPFISFDAVSYLAGLTDLRWSLFAVATLTGMIPMTFLFAHLGGAMTADEEPLRVLNLLALLGLAGLLWMGWRLRSR